MMKWEVKSLGEVCKTGAGGTPTKSVQSFYEPPSIPWLLSGEVEQREIRSTKNYISEEGLSKSSAKIFPPNSVLVAMYGANAGEVGVLKIAASTNQAVCAIYPSDFLHHDFIYFYLLFYQNDLASQAVGGAQPNISQTKVKAVPIPIPPLEEQEEIVALLDSAFEKIDEAKANVERNLKNAEELFQSALDQVFSNPGEDWEMKALGEVCTIQIGRTPARKNPSNWDPLKKTQNIWLSIADLRHAEVVNDSSEYFSDLARPSMKVIPEGTLLVSFKLTLGRTSIAGCNLFTNEAIAALLNLNEAVNQRFLMHFFDAFDWKKACRGDIKLKGYTFNKAKLTNLEIPIPPLEEQQEIVTHLDALSGHRDEVVAKCNQELLDLEELRQSILEQAFEGKLTQSPA